jgi:hypothetical protein
VSLQVGLLKYFSWKASLTNHSIDLGISVGILVQKKPIPVHAERYPAAALAYDRSHSELNLYFR